MPVAAERATLSRWLYQLAVRADSLPERGTGDDCAVVWDEIRCVAAQAHALHETDTLYSIITCLLGKKLYPPEDTLWSSLAAQLLTYADVELSSVAYYPGLPDTQHRQRRQALVGGAEVTSPVAHNTTVDAEAQLGVLYPTRETLLMTGGTVPLSSRLRCGDGEMTGHFLTCFVRYLEHRGTPTTPTEADSRRALLHSISTTILRAMTSNLATLQYDALVEPLCAYLVRLHHEERANAIVAHTTESVSPRLLLPFVQELCSASISSCGALGARLALRYLAGEYSGGNAAAVAPPAINDRARTGSFDPAEEKLRLQLVHCVAQGLYHFYTAPRVSASAYRAAPHLQILYDELDVVFQRNANEANALQIDATVQEQMRLELSLALLRALRLESSTPDAFLRAAMPVVERCSATVAIEAELIAGKVALLDAMELDESGRQVVYDDLLNSLRTLVELHPRSAGAEVDAGQGLVDDVGVVGNGRLAASGGQEVGGGGYGEECYSVLQHAERGQVVLDALSQARLQEAHVQVLRALCQSHDERRLNEAYGVVIAHKYHGLVVTSEVIQPLMQELSSRGDCRVFNLVDLCVLYCDCPIEMDTIVYLFRACAVAGDYYRAASLLELLKETLPGFLARIPEQLCETLRGLKLLDPPPAQLFVSEEERMVSDALGGSATDGGPVAAELRPLQ